MLVGNCSVLNTESSQMGKCHLIKLSEEEMMHSTPSFLRLELENTSQELFFLIYNPQLLTKLEQELTDNSSIQNNLFPENRMQQTTLPEDITQLENKLLIFVLIESENWPTIVPVFKDF